MVLDHIHQMFYSFGAPLYLNILGRVVVPIFMFMLSEGFHYTASRAKYLKRLIIGSWIMNIGNFALSNYFKVSDIQLDNNIFATLFLSGLYIWGIDTLLDSSREMRPSQKVRVLLVMLLPFVIYGVKLTLGSVAPIAETIVNLLAPDPVTTEGELPTVALGALFYFLRPYGRGVQMIPLIAYAILIIPAYYINGDIQFMMILAVIPLLIYNGKEGRKEKWLFYTFYPAHIWILYSLSAMLQ